LEDAGLEIAARAIAILKDSTRSARPPCGRSTITSSLRSHLAGRVRRSLRHDPFLGIRLEDGKDRFKLYWTALKHRENGTEAFERIFMADMIKARAAAIRRSRLAGCPGQVREDLK